MNMTDDEIRSFFHEHRPSVPDAGKYTERLCARLESMEEIKRIRDEAVGRNRTVVLFTFIAGLVSGTALTLFLLFNPSVLHPDLSGILSASVIEFIKEWRYVFILIPAIISITCSLVPSGRK